MRRSVVAFAVFAALLVGVVTASAGDGTGMDRIGTSKAPTLTKAERDALDIVSVHVVGEEGLGMMAVVTFRGNIQKALGRGHLKQGLVAMILRPKSAGQNPAALVTRGVTIDAVLRKTRSEQVGAVRNGRTIVFFVGGPGYSNVARVELRTFANVPLASARRTSAGPPTLSEEEFKNISTLDSLDKLITLADSKQLTCEQLEQLNRGALFYIQALTKADFNENIDPLTDKELAPLRDFQVAIKTRLDDQCKNTPKTPEAEFAWSFFGTSKNEVTGKGFFDELSGRKVVSITIRVPDHDIDAALCPPQLPKLTFVARDTIRCGGEGGLAERIEFTANVRTSPDPEKFMGGQLTAKLNDGTAIGPISISGP